MSWDPYVETLTAGGFHHSCIAGHNGQVWGTTPNFKILSTELTTLAKALSGADDAVERKLQDRGFTLQGIAYALTRVEDGDEARFLIGRCKERGAPAKGVIVARTSKTVIVALHDPVFSDKKSFGRANVAICQLAESLAGMSF